MTLKVLLLLILPIAPYLHAQIVTDSMLTDTLFNQERYGVGYMSLEHPGTEKTLDLWWVLGEQQIDSVLALRDFWMRPTKNLYISPVLDDSTDNLLGLLFYLVPEGSPAWIHDLQTEEVGTFIEWYQPYLDSIYEEDIRKSDNYYVE